MKIVGVVQRDATIGIQMEIRVILIFGKVIIDQTIVAWIIIGGVDTGNEQFVVLRLISIVSTSDRRWFVDENELFSCIVERVVKWRIMIILIEDVDAHFSLTGLLSFVIQSFDLESIDWLRLSVEISCHGDHAVARIDGEWQRCWAFVFTQVIGDWNRRRETTVRWHLTCSNEKTNGSVPHSFKQWAKVSRESEIDSIWAISRRSARHA